MSRPTVRYRRGLHPRTAYVVPLTIWLHASAWLLTLWPGGPSAFSVAVSLILPALILITWTGTLLYHNISGRLMVTEQTLRVGRSRAVPLTRLDRDWLLALARHEVPEAYLRHAGPGATWTPQTPTPRPRLVGQQWGPQDAGDDSIDLRLDNGEVITFAVADSAEVVAVLLDARSAALANP